MTKSNEEKWMPTECFWWWVGGSISRHSREIFNQLELVQQLNFFSALSFNQ